MKHKLYSFYLFLVEIKNIVDDHYYFLLLDNSNKKLLLILIIPITVAVLAFFG